MSYSKQNFTTGQVLTAEHLNNIEKGIVANENAIAEKQPKGDYATEGFVTDKIAEAQLGGDGTNVDLSAYAKTEDIAKNYQPKGNYLTQHQKIKTINGQSMVGEGNIQIAASAPQNKTGFEGKVISVLGDSISAMQGYIPVEDGFNLKHDPQYTTGFGVDNMWWKIVINRLGAKLGICDAWDGTRVVNTSEVDSGKSGPNSYIGSSTRLINLGSNGTPDVILIFAGTNDARSGISSSDTFEATKEYAPITEEELYTNTTTTKLAEAYTALIQKLQYLYPYTKLVALAPMYGKSFSLTPQARMASLKIIRDVCDYFGVLLLDPIKAGINMNNTYNGNRTYFKDGIHPNENGMKLIGDFVYKQIRDTLEVKEGENVVYAVTNQLDTLTTNKPHVKGVSKGTTYSAKLSGTSDFTGVKIYMGTSDVTSSALASDGTITITNVSGAIVIADKDIEPPTIQTYSITFEENGGSVVADLTGQTELPNPLPTTTRSGYTFDGWYTNSNLTAAANPGATLNSNITLYAKWTEIVEPDDGEDEGASGESGIIDPASVNWYVDYTSAGGNFNYTDSFPGFVFADSNTVAAMQGVPINAVKVLPGGAGEMNIYKVTGTDISNIIREDNPIATFVISEEDVITSAPTDGSQAKAYRLATTITLANNERLLIKGGTSGDIYVSTANKPAGSNVIVDVPTSGSTGTAKAEAWCGSVGYGYISDTGTNPPVEPDEPVEPDDGDEGGSGGIVIDPASITWYVDNADQTGKTFDYTTHHPGAAFRVDATAAKLRNVPINAVKLHPSKGGVMNFARWVPGTAPVVAATINIPEADVYTSKPSDTDAARIYLLSDTITLADNEYLLCKCKMNDATGGLWVNAGSSADYAVYTWNNADNTAKTENWGLGVSIGYQ